MAITATLALSGCTSFLFSEDGGSDTNSKLEELLSVPETPDLIGDAAKVFGMSWAHIRGVGVVHGLNGTGAPAKPSPLRDHLIAEMLTHSVHQPERYLESDDVAMVIVNAIVPPGVRRGDPIDVHVSVPSESDVTSLAGGRLRHVRLYEMLALGHRIRKSDLLAIASGPILTKSVCKSQDDKESDISGVVLGGATWQKSRPMGLAILPEYQNVAVATRFAKRINKRFYFFDGMSRRGVATAKRPDYVELDIHPRYRKNLHRMASVIRSLSASAVDKPLSARLEVLATKMREPTTALSASLQLEAIGDDGVPTLIEALSNPSPEIRFYAAEALAYLDRAEAIEPLTQLASAERAFRYSAITALTDLDLPEASDAMRRLLNDPSKETRYGAFVGLQTRRDDVVVDARVKLGRDFRLYQIRSTADPLVAISTHLNAEIVIFGGPCPIVPNVRFKGKRGLSVRGEAGRLRIERFVSGLPPQETTVTANVAALCMGIAEVGGTYGDCIEVLKYVKRRGSLNARVKLDPSPKAQRTYRRDSETASKATGFEAADEIPPEEITPPPKPRPRVWYNPMTWRKA